MAKKKGYIEEIPELSSNPASPGAGYSTIFPKTDGFWYYKNSAGQVRQFFASRRGSGSEVSGDVEINDAEVCVITTEGTAIKSGETYTFTLTSNLITASSAFAHYMYNDSNTTGLPVILSIAPDTGFATVKILNIGGQSNSDDTDGTLILTIVIL